MWGISIRNAIEEELEVLYDAYYEELEQYANYQQRYVSSGGTIPPPPGPGPFPGSVELDKNGAVVGSHHKAPNAHPPVRPKTVMTNGRKPTKTGSEFEDDEGDEEEYDEEEEYEEDEEDDEEDDAEGEEEEEVKSPRVNRKYPPATPKARAVNGVNKVNGRADGLFNLGSSLTVTGKFLLSNYCYMVLMIRGRSWQHTYRR